MNLAGIPPFSGFIGKLGLLQAGVADGGPLALTLVAGGVVTSLLTLLAIARVWNRAFWRPASQEPLADTAAAAARRRRGARAGPGGAATPHDASGADRRRRPGRGLATARGGGHRGHVPRPPGPPPCARCARCRA